MLALGAQSCAVYAGGEVGEDSAQSGAGAVGILVALLFLIAAALVIGRPQAAKWIFLGAGAVALIGATTDEFPDLFFWAVGAGVLSLMSHYGERETAGRRPPT